MKLISDKVTMAIATQLHSFDLLPTTTFEDMQEKLSDDAVIKRYRNDPVFHAKVCSLTASVLRSVGDDIATLTRQRDLAVKALEHIARSLPQIGVERVWMMDHANNVLSTIKESEAMAQGEKGV